MSEETNQQEGTWTGLKKTIVGTLATVVTAGGAWLGSTLFGGGNDTAQPVQAQPSIIINNTQQQQQAAGGKTIIIKEKETVKEATAKPKKKERDEFKEKEPLW
jgi:hypothetical protein